MHHMCYNPAGGRIYNSSSADLGHEGGYGDDVGRTLGDDSDHVGEVMEAGSVAESDCSMALALLSLQQ